MPIPQKKKNFKKKSLRSKKVRDKRLLFVECIAILQTEHTYTHVTITSVNERVHIIDIYSFEINDAIKTVRYNIHILGVVNHAQSGGFVSFL